MATILQRQKFEKEPLVPTVVRGNSLPVGVHALVCLRDSPKQVKAWTPTLRRFIAAERLAIAFLRRA